jgi:nucleoside-diphosphate-sugar epimerase
VVGGAGYIGSVLVGTLLDQGYRVRVLDCLLYDNRYAIADFENNERFEFAEGDFTDQYVLRRSLDRVTDVVLLAAIVGDPPCKKYPELAAKINDKGTIDLIQQLNGHNIDRFVFMSTCSNYGLRETDAEATEKSELKPQSLYAETKVKVERYILESAGQLDFQSTVLRCATAYGLSPRMRFDLTVNEVVRDLALKRELLVYDADTWRPYCHTTDISWAIASVLAASPEKVAGEVFNVGARGENYTKRMIVETLIKELPDAEVRYREGSVDPRNYRVSFEKIAATLGFEARRTVTDYIPELIGFVASGQFGDEDARYGNYRIRPDYS